MLRFALGVVVGVTVSQPLLNMVNEHLTPPVRRKIIKTVNGLADRINNWVETQEQENNR